MSTSTEQILKEAMALPLQERAELVERLLGTFQSPPDLCLDELWARAKLRIVWMLSSEVNSRQFRLRRFLTGLDNGARNEANLS